jgi:hypothetical protein
MLGAGYNSYYQIAQTRDVVAINMEMMHDIRIIPMDGRPMPPKTLTGRLGYSRGRWEGDTLVVETGNFSERRRFGARSTTPTTQLTERFTRMDASTLEYEVTFNDPETYTRPWTAVLYWKLEPNDKIYEFACHEGNLAMPGTLSGYRAQERAAAEAARKGSR